MRATPTALPGVLLLEPRRYTDPRGFFMETYSELRYREAGVDARFVQDNHSFSRAGVLRGLHYQLGAGQAKLVWVCRGEISDVVVDVRRGSPTFGRWVRAELSADNGCALFIPPFFAHGFIARTDTDLIYKCSDYYRPDAERGVHYADPELAVRWDAVDPTISERDANLPCLRRVPEADLPRFAGG